MNSKSNARIHTSDAAKKDRKDGEEVLLHPRRIILAKMAVKIATKCVHAESGVIAVHGHVIIDLIRLGQFDLLDRRHEETHDDQYVAEKCHGEKTCLQYKTRLQ